MSVQNQKFMGIIQKSYPPKKGLFGGGGSKLLNVVLRRNHLKGTSISLHQRGAGFYLPPLLVTLAKQKKCGIF